MSETTDLVLPILKAMQSELAALRAKLDDVASAQLAQGDRFDKLEGYITYHMGQTFQHTADIAGMRKDVLDLKKRVAALETH